MHTSCFRRPGGSRFLLAALAIGIAAIAVYLPALGNQFVNLDDTQYVSENPMVSGGLTLPAVRWAFTTGHASNWHPLTWISHQLDVELFALQPAGHHLTNLLLHAAASVSLFVLVAGLTGRFGVAVFTAALFAVHPLHVESVGWIAERKDVLSGLLWILATGAYLWYRRRPALPRYLLVLLLFAAALLAKQMPVTFPLLLLLLDWWPLGCFDPARRGAAGRLRPLLIEKIPFALLAAAAAVIVYQVQRHFGAMGTLNQYPLDVRLANAAVSYLWYLGKTLWPSALAVIYQHRGSALPWWQGLAAGALAVALTLAALRSARRAPYLLAGWLWYLVSLLPAIGLVQVGEQARADRYVYVPVIGVFLLAGMTVSQVVARQPRLARLATALGAAALLAFALAATAQLSYWRDGVTLFRHAVAVSPESGFANNMLGEALGRAGQTAEAATYIAKGVELDPSRKAYLHFVSGNFYYRTMQIDKALAEYRLTLELLPPSQVERRRSVLDAIEAIERTRGSRP
jgi:tetratricopeptide (TPR) repeat protein